MFGVSFRTIFTFFVLIAPPPESRRPSINTFSNIHCCPKEKL
jgi:hypothetical protein